MADVLDKRVVWGSLTPKLGVTRHGLVDRGQSTAMLQYSILSRGITMANLVWSWQGAETHLLPFGCYRGEYLQVGPVTLDQCPDLDAAWNGS